MRKIGIILMLAMTSFSMCVVGQIKGKAEHLEGIWKYDGGSGYEVWELKGDVLVGYGYRMTKFGDTMRVEDLRIARVNKNYVYSMTTKQLINGNTLVNKYNFLGKNRSLSFTNIESGEPLLVSYKFGFFNKKRLKIIIEFQGEKSPTKLKLRRVEAI